MKRRTGWIAGFAAMAVLLATAVTAFGYPPEAGVKGVVTVSAHGTVTCGTGLALTATFVDANGLPVSGLSVDWSFVTSSASDTLNKTPTTTDSKGVAKTTVTLGPVSGSRTIKATAKATADTFSATAVLSASCGHSGGVLPNTSTLPPSETAPGQAAPFLGMLLALLPSPSPSAAG